MKYTNVIVVGAFLGLGKLMFMIGRSILQTEERFNHFVGALWLQNGLVFLLIFFLFLTQKLVFQTVAWSLMSIQILSGVAVAVFGFTGFLERDWIEKINSVAQMRDV